MLFCFYKLLKRYKVFLFCECLTIFILMFVKICQDAFPWLFMFSASEVQMAYFPEYQHFIIVFIVSRVNVLVQWVVL